MQTDRAVEHELNTESTPNNIQPLEVKLPNACILLIISGKLYSRAMNRTMLFKNGNAFVQKIL